MSIIHGHKDIVKLLCKSDPSMISYKDMLGLDCIECAQEHLKKNKDNDDVSRLYEKIIEILREFDERCSYCKAKPAKLRSCPCKKERYCDVNCQRKRWKEHKELHMKVLGNTPK